MPKKNQAFSGDGPPAPRTVEELREAITARYPELSQRLQQVARYVIDHPNDMAVETLAVIAERCKVQPSTVVRFAKAFGYDGASQMQRLFRDKLLKGQAALSYQERVRHARSKAKEGTKDDSLLGLLSGLVESNIMALEHLYEGVSEETMRRVATLIDEAETVYVSGTRRSFPIAAFISYTLSRFGKRTHFIDGVGGFTTIQRDFARKRDLLIAVSYTPYAPETVDFVSHAAARKCRIVSFTDSRFSPIAGPADIALVIQEADVSGFRSLTSSFTLAQALLLGYAFMSQQDAAI